MVTNSGKFDLAINNGRVFIGGRFEPVNVGIKKGKVVSLSAEKLKGEQEIDATDLKVIPGVIDPHMHVFYGYPYENFQNATKAAAKGGITTIIDMPLDLPVLPSTPELIRKKIEDGESQSLIDFALFGAISVEGGISAVEKIMRTGVVGIKIFWEGGARESMIKCLNTWEIWQVFKILKMNNLTAAVHSDNASIIENETKRLIEAGKMSPEFYEDARPIVSEYTAIASTIVLAQNTGCRVNFCHTSFSQGVEFINEFKKNGVDAYVETCPHYLTLTKEDLKRDKRLKVNPPLRANEKEGLWKLIKEGKIDTIGSDHIPFPKDLSKSIWDIWGGLGNMVQIMLPLILTEGVYKYGIPLEKIITLMTENPAKVYRLYPRKGCISIGSDADLVILNTKAQEKIKADSLAYVGEKWSPWDGWEIRFSICQVILRGQTIMKNGEILQKPGIGKFVPVLG